MHGAENDFLLTWGNEATGHDCASVARRMCARTTGVGADGWMLIWRTADGIRTRLFNSDGSEPELSGNGTRCAAAFALLHGAASPPTIYVDTKAGRKRLTLLERTQDRFLFEMEMGTPTVEELRTSMELSGETFDVTLLNVGNPQCAIFVNELPRSWRGAAAEAERHPRFPNRTNVSFVRVLDKHTIDVVFYERGAGETRSSGTGSTGAGAAAVLRGVVESPVQIRTPAGPLSFRWDSSIYVTGPAELIAEGTFYLDDSHL